MGTSMMLTVVNDLAFLPLLLLNAGASWYVSANDRFHNPHGDDLIRVSDEAVAVTHNEAPHDTCSVVVEVNNIDGSCYPTGARDPTTSWSPVTIPPELDSVIETGYGPGQLIVLGEGEDKTRQVIADMHQYMHGTVYHEDYPYYEIREQCVNADALCAHWAATGECEHSPAYMQLECAPACHSCERVLRRLRDDANDDNNTLDLNYGVPQKIVDTDADAIRTLADHMIQYMENVVYQDNYSFPEIRDQCQNRDEHCLYWAVTEQCEIRPAYMKTDCAPACLACEDISFEFRCRDFHPPVVVGDNNSSDNETNLLSTQDNAWKPGDLNAMFERILSTSSEYNSTILSRPSDDDDEVACSSSIDLSKSADGSDRELELVQPVRRQPWIVIIDDFLTAEECERLIELGGKIGYETSVDVGEMKFDGTYDGIRHEGRTSTNAWCVNDCYSDPVAQQVLARMENLTGIPDTNTEPLQLLKYEVGQFYEAHHDYVEHHLSRAQGVRVLTIFLYLNDVVAGGGTHFTELNLTVMPKQGRALLWPSVYNESPDIQDPITEHEALPVVEGVKYGANAWFHQRDFKTPFHYNCI